jgi:hypothetical protein
MSASKLFSVAGDTLMDADLQFNMVSLTVEGWLASILKQKQNSPAARVALFDCNAADPSLPPEIHLTNLGRGILCWLSDGEAVFLDPPCLEQVGFDIPGALSS